MTFNLDWSGKDLECTVVCDIRYPPDAEVKIVKTINTSNFPILFMDYSICFTPQRGNILMECEGEITNYKSDDEGNAFFTDFEYESIPEELLDTFSVELELKYKRWKGEGEPITETYVINQEDFQSPYIFRKEILVKYTDTTSLPWSVELEEMLYPMNMEYTIQGCFAAKRVLSGDQYYIISNSGDKYQFFRNDSSVDINYGEVTCDKRYIECQSYLNMIPETLRGSETIRKIALFTCRSKGLFKTFGNIIMSFLKLVTCGDEVFRSSEWAGRVNLVIFKFTTLMIIILGFSRIFLGVWTGMGETVMNGMKLLIMTMILNIIVCYEVISFKLFGTLITGFINLLQNLHITSQYAGGTDYVYYIHVLIGFLIVSFQIGMAVYLLRSESRKKQKGGKKK